MDKYINTSIYPSPHDELAEMVLLARYRLKIMLPPGAAIFVTDAEPLTTWGWYVSNYTRETYVNHSR